MLKDSYLYGKVRHYFGDMWRRKTLHHEYPGKYRKASAGKPVQKNKVIFMEVRADHITDSFALLYNALCRQNEEAAVQQGTKAQYGVQRAGRDSYTTGPKWDIQTVYLEEGMKNRRIVRDNCLKAIDVIADAKFIFIDDSCYFLSCLPLRRETKVIQVWHACGAFKKFGWSVTDKLFGASVKGLQRFPVHKNWDYVTVSSPEVIWAYAQAFHMEDRKEDILPTGISRTDVFFDPVRLTQAKQLVSSVMAISRGKKIILYAPTFRGKVALAEAPDQLDIPAMKKALGDRYVLLIKQHPFVKNRPPVPEDCAAFAMDVTDQMAIDDLLMVSDICISDYSSLVFEYSLFERPMLFFAYDLADYGDWRGFYYAYDQMTPGPIVKTTDEIIDYINHVEERFDKEKVCAFRDKFMSACDGRATERILALLKD